MMCIVEVLSRIRNYTFGWWPQNSHWHILLHILPIVFLVVLSTARLTAAISPVCIKSSLFFQSGFSITLSFRVQLVSFTSCVCCVRRQFYTTCSQMHPFLLYLTPFVRRYNITLKIYLALTHSTQPECYVDRIYIWHTQSFTDTPKLNTKHFFNLFSHGIYFCSQQNEDWCAEDCNPSRCKSALVCIYIVWTRKLRGWTRVNYVSKCMSW
jgi:hypothetical protein